jgi:hypothetical protein
MKRELMLVVFVMVAAASLVQAEDAVYGNGVTLSEAVAIDTLLAHPEDYVGKNVRVDGVITGVCKKRGCWMQVTNPDTGAGVRIKVEDGVIVFPYESMGHRAQAEGVFQAIAVEPAQGEAGHGDHAEHAEGESCDKSAEGQKAGCDAPKKDNVIYLIQGSGAKILA